MKSTTAGPCTWMAVPTTEELRVVATMFQGDFSSNLANWGVAVVLFFDPNNYVSLNRIRDNGEK